MKKLCGIVAVSVAVILGIQFFPEPSYANFPPERGTTWVAFGDSLTSGAGALDDQSYPATLSARLGVQIVNRGIPGNTTEDGLNRIDQILQLNPKVVLLCLGGNGNLNRQNTLLRSNQNQLR